MDNGINITDFIIVRKLKIKEEYINRKSKFDIIFDLFKHKQLRWINRFLFGLKYKYIKIVYGKTLRRIKLRFIANRKKWFRQMVDRKFIWDGLSDDVITVNDLSAMNTIVDYVESMVSEYHEEKNHEDKKQVFLKLLKFQDDINF